MLRRRSMSLARKNLVVETRAVHRTMGVERTTDRTNSGRFALLYVTSGDPAFILEANAGKPLLFFGERQQKFPPCLGDHAPVKNSAATLQTSRAYPRTLGRIIQQPA